jgi:hypothetical protein
MPCGGIREGSARELCVREANLSHSRRLVHSMWRSCDRDPSELNGYRSMIGRDPEIVGIRKGSSLWRVCRGTSLLLISGLAGATLVRLAPGFGVDEQTLDPRLSARSVEALNKARRRESDPLRFYGHYVGAVLRGDAGRSSVFGQPVLDLIGERAPTTVRSVASGLTIAWAAAILLATIVALGRWPPVVPGLTLFSGLLVSMPSAVVATACLLLGFPPGTAIAGVIFSAHVSICLRASPERAKGATCHYGACERAD